MLKLYASVISACGGVGGVCGWGEGICFPRIYARALMFDILVDKCDNRDTRNIMWTVTSEPCSREANAS